jgi:two-component sensor histidine kinase
MLPKNFTKDQMNILRRCSLCADLAADIAHARLSIYTADTDPKCLYVYAQSKPLTNFLMHSPSQVGRSIRKVEEPLVDRTMESGVVLSGKREWELGIFAQTKLFPLYDGKHKVFAVAAFEVNIHQENTTEMIFIDAAMEILLGVDTSQIKENINYRRLTTSDGVLIVNADNKILAVNDNAKHILSLLGVIDPVGKRVNSVQINWPLVSMALKTGIAESKELKEQDLQLDLRVIPITATLNPDVAVVILTDVTALKEKEEELYIKSVVIKEIHHRVKNNLQTIASLLRMQSRRTHSQEAKDILRDAINRVNSIAIVHESLSQQEQGEIDLSQVANDIYHAVLSSMVAPDLHLNTSFAVDKVLLPSQEATNIALTLNELLQNAIEHGFANRKEGTLKVSFSLVGSKGILEIQDDGVGLKPGFDLKNTDSLGLKIVQTMVETDLGGKFELIPLKQGNLCQSCCTN